MKKTISLIPSVKVSIVGIILLFSLSIYAQQTTLLPQAHSYKQADSLRQIFLKKQSFDTALVYANQSLSLVEKQYGKNDTLYADMLSVKMQLLYYMSNYPEAINCLIQEKEIREKTQGKDNPSYGSTLGNLANLYQATGHYDKALPMQLEALENTKQYLGKNNSIYSVRLVSLAVLYKNMEQFDKALPLFNEALENIKNTTGKENSMYAQTLNNLAVLYEDMGQYEKALPIMKESIDITKSALGKENRRYGNRLNNLAFIYHSMGDYDKALPLYEESLENCIKSYGKSNAYCGIRLNNIAEIYRAMNKYSKALSTQLDALDILKKTLGEDHNLYGISLNNLALTYQGLEDYDNARITFIEALESCRKNLGTEHSYYATRAGNLANLYATTGQVTEALPLYIDALKNVNQNISKNFSFLSEKEKEAYFNMKTPIIESFNSFCLQTKEQYSYLTDIVYDNTVRNKGILLKSSTAMRMAILSSNDSDLIEKYNAWIDLNKEIIKLYSTPIAKRKRNPKQLEDQATILERELVNKSQEFTSFSKTVDLNWHDVQKALRPIDNAIEFINFRLYNKTWTDSIIYCALVITPTSQHPAMIPLFEQKQLEAIIGKFGGNNYNYINSIYGKNDEINTQLYNLIWAPIDQYFDSVGVNRKHTNTKTRVYISPSGLLHKISFPAIAKKQDIYLCDIYDMEMKSTTGKIASSGSVKTIHESSQPITATLFGGINYNTDSTTYKGWNYLEGTKTETQKIDKILKKGKVEVNYFTNSNATEEEFKQMASNSNIIHIATHGFFYPDPDDIEQEEDTIEVVEEIVFRGGSRGFGVNSFVENTNPLMRSGLVFAGANDVWSKENRNDSLDDGVLTAQEVANVDMRKTQLVVMSACETGLGDIKGSEGVYGLQRAFKMAGVNYMIMSLWQVPDKETEEFMTKFYKKLIKTKDIKQSFAETQKEMRKKYDPYFWAAFVLVE